MPPGSQVLLAALALRVPLVRRVPLVAREILVLQDELGLLANPAILGKMETQEGRVPRGLREGLDLINQPPLQLPSVPLPPQLLQPPLPNCLLERQPYLSL